MEPPIYIVMSGKYCLYEATSLDSLAKTIIDKNESTQMRCPDITEIRRLDGDEEFILPWRLVSAFLDELERKTDFIPYKDEDTGRD